MASARWRVYSNMPQCGIWSTRSSVNPHTSASRRSGESTCPKLAKRQGKSGSIDVKALMAEDEEVLRALVRTALQEVLDAEMTEAVGAEKGERTAGRQGYRPGYCGRTRITRVGKLELLVPQDRMGRFSTELFERYQRSERALVAALA